jgi:hypothetical protein
VARNLTPPSDLDPTPPSDTELTKEELQRRMDEARRSISNTVEEIKGTVEDEYASVKATVTGILDWRAQFSKEPILWSVGALTAGFALGYSLGRAQPQKSRAKGKKSEVAVFADSLAAELGTVAKSLPLATLDPKMKAILGFGLSDLFAEIGAGTVKGRQRSKRAAAKRRPRARR